MSIMNAELKSLVAKRNSIKSSITRLATFYKTVTQTQMTSELLRNLQNRLASFVPLLDNFHEVMDKIENLDQTNVKNYLSERESFENDYHSLRAKIETFIDASKPKPSKTLSNKEIPDNSNLVEPKFFKSDYLFFDGSYDKWAQFSEKFETEYHFNKEIAPMEKFCWLKCFLRDEAAHTIESIPYTSENYESAWKLLCDNYGNKQRNVFKHIQNIFEIEPIARESYTELESLLNSLSSNMKVLESLGQPVNTWDTFIVHLVERKLDPITRCDWETRLTLNDVPVLSQLINFLKNKCESLKSRILKTSSFSKHCPVCYMHHRIYQCPQFQSFEKKDAWDTAILLNLCTNCLCKGHKNEDCQSIICCKECDERHHTLLHKDDETDSDDSSQSSDSTLLIFVEKTCNICIREEYYLLNK